MCNCIWYNGDSCDYPDATNGQTEDSYCKFEAEDDEDEIDCDEYREDDNHYDS